MFPFSVVSIGLKIFNCLLHLNINKVLMQTPFPTKATHLLASLPFFLPSLLHVEMISSSYIKCTPKTIFWMPPHSETSVYWFLLFFPVSLTFSFLLACSFHHLNMFSFYHLQTKHKDKSPHDPHSPLAASNPPFFTHNILINNNSPN